MSLFALLASSIRKEHPPGTGLPPIAPDPGYVNLYPAVAAPSVPTPLAHWDFREPSPPYYTTAATGNDLPLGPKTTDPVRVISEIGGALHMDGSQSLFIPPEDLGRLHIGGSGGTAVTVSAWVFFSRRNQVAIAGIWGEFADPPQRQYALFYDLPAYGGPEMSCFHVSKDGAPTPGYPYSTDYSANPRKATLGRWHHFLGTYDGDRAVSYIDGFAYQYTTESTRAGDGGRNPYTFGLGLNSSPHEFAVSIGGPMFGMIADVKVWGTALTPGQVMAVASEHRPQGLPTLAPGVGYQLTGDKYVNGTSDASHAFTFSDMPIGDASADRLVVAAVQGTQNPQHALLSATIGGVSATVVQIDGTGFAYAVVPTGTTADVVATWAGETTSDHYCAVFVVDGTKKVHSSSGGGSVVKSMSVGGSRGALTIAFARLSSDAASWSPYITRLTQGKPAGSTSGQYSLAVGVSPGGAYPVSLINGLTSASRTMLAITFDPATD